MQWQEYCLKYPADCLYNPISIRVCFNNFEMFYCPGRNRKILENLRGLNHWSAAFKDQRINI